MVYFQGFRRNNRGNVALISAIMFPILAGLGLGGYSLSTWNAQKSAARSAIDAAALAGVAMFAGGSASADQIETTARDFLKVNTAKAPEALPASATITVDMAERTVKIDFDGLADGTFSSPLWDGLISVKVSSTAKYGSAPMPVCILITELVDKHTYRSSKGSKTDVKDCMVQVNTANWDAVEADSSSYIHAVNGQNCFVGDIHFGDVSPAKSATCTFFPDPFAKYVIPNAGGCNSNNLKVSFGGTLSPGVYCKGLEIASSVTLAPGIYYIKNGPLTVTGSGTNVKADGVTIILTGTDSAINIVDGNTWTQTPTTGAGKFSGFLFFLDQSTLEKSGAASVINGINMNSTGIIYLAGQRLVLGPGTNLNIKPGSIVAGYLLGQGGNLNFTGTLANSTLAEAAMRKPTMMGAALVK